MRLPGSIGAKILALTVFAALVALALGVSGWAAVSSQGEELDRVDLMQQAMADQSEADGANHAIQYDVVAAAGAASHADRTDYLDDLTERIGQVQGIAHLRAVVEASGDPGLRSRFAGVGPVLDRYVTAARSAHDELNQPGRISAERGQAIVAAVNTAEEAFDARFDALTQSLRGYTESTRDIGRRHEQNSRRRALLVLGLAVVLVPAFGLAIRRAINTTITPILEVIDATAAGDLTRLVTAGGRDPIGRMRTGMAGLLDHLRGNIGRISGASRTLAAASERLLALTAQMAEAGASVSGKADAASSAAGRVSANVAGVSRNTGELDSAIQDIARSTSQASQVALSAMQVATDTNATVAKLSDSSAEISEVVGLIGSIAKQTNLLALNATIEAARAGDAGKGFAVVASEVKDLAGETAKATADVSRRIEAIQADAQAAVAAIEQISRIITQVNEIQTAIASAVQQQSTTTAEIGHSITRAATGSTDIAEAITAVARTSRETNGGLSQTQQAAEDVARMVAELDRLAAEFTY